MFDVTKLLVDVFDPQEGEVCFKGVSKRLVVEHGRVGESHGLNLRPGAGSEGGAFGAGTDPPEELFRVGVVRGADVKLARAVVRYDVGLHPTVRDDAVYPRLFPDVLAQRGYAVEGLDERVQGIHSQFRICRCMGR